MIWLCLALLALLTIAPTIGFALRASRARGRQEAALALHRAQLRELDRDLDEGRLLAPEHEAAKLEVQRRLLADAALPDPSAPRASFTAIVAACLFVPTAALALYLSVGHPNFPAGAENAATAAPTPSQTAEMQKAIAEIEQLSLRLRTMDPHAAKTLDGYEILGRAELSIGNLPAAADAWQHVLADRFDPTMAAETAEILTEIAGKVTPESLDLFRHALAAAPADAQWRPMAEKRIAEGGK